MGKQEEVEKKQEEKQKKEERRHAEKDSEVSTPDVVAKGTTTDCEVKAEDAAEKKADKLETQGDDVVQKLAGAGAVPPTPSQKKEEEKEKGEKKREEKAEEKHEKKAEK